MNSENTSKLLSLRLYPTAFLVACDAPHAQFIVAQRLERPAPIVYEGVNKNVILPKAKVTE